MPDNTPNQLQEILKTLQTKTVVVQPQQSYMDLIDQAEQAILALFMGCLPEKQNYGPTEFVDGFDAAIDITAQHMRALGSRDEPVHV